MYLQDSLSQLSRIGVGSVLGDIMRGEGGGDDSSEDYDSDQEEGEGENGYTCMRIVHILRCKCSALTRPN